PRAPDRQLPKSFETANETAAAAQAHAASSAQRTWSEFFASPELRSLIETALSNNQELNVRLQEIMIAHNEVSARQGDYLPRVGAFVGGGVDHVGHYTSQGASDDATRLPSNLGDFTFGLTGSWEVDIWRRLRDARDAADLRYFASIEAKSFMATQLIAEVARSYYELIAIDNQLEILRHNIEIQADALKVVKLEQQAARVTSLAVQRFEAEVLKNKSRVYDVEQAKVQTENRINFLLGRYPQPVRRRPQEFTQPMPAVVNTGLPAQLLDNRPDVRQAELALAAAKLDVKVTKAAFYPSLTIDAALGYRAFNVAHLVSTPASLIYNLAGSLVAPLLNRQAITAAYQSANSRQVQAVYNYEKTLLQAFTDVANQLAKFENLQKSYELQAQQVDTLARSVDISKLLFQSARADYMEVLLTRRDSLEAQMELVETKRRQFEATVSIYQALGGGWRAD
ncbi:MAG: TolC family protein, partial [Deltaproteobacteria bacterium]